MTRDDALARLLFLALLASLVLATAAARSTPKPRARPVASSSSPSPSSPSTPTNGDARPLNFAHASAHAALCAFHDAGLPSLGACDVSSTATRKLRQIPDELDADADADDDDDEPVPPAFIYDSLLTANLVLSFTSLYRQGEVLSLAGVVNERNLATPPRPPGAPILVPGANATSVVVQAAAGVVRVNGLTSTFLAFTPEYAAAQAAFTEGDGGAATETEDETSDVVNGKRRRRLLAAEEDALRAEGERDAAAAGAATAAGRGENVDAAMSAHESLSAYVNEVLNRSRAGGAADDAFDGGDDDEGGMLFHMKRSVKSPEELSRLAAAGFWREFPNGFSGDALRALESSLLGGMYNASTANVTSQGFDGRDPDDAASEGEGDEEEKLRERLRSVAEQLSDVAPRFDFEVSVTARQIVNNLFAGVAARTWSHAAIRVGPEEIEPYAYVDPLGLVATDLYPEVAAAYVRSLRDAGASEEEIGRKLRDAVSARFLISVLFVTRQQISVNGGDILRNIFSLTL